MLTLWQTWRWRLLALALVILALSGSCALRNRRNGRIREGVVSLLKSEALAFLCTDRLVAQVAVEIRDNTLLRGAREGILVATVRVYHGVNLKRPDRLRISPRDRDIVIVIPEPEVLDYAIDMASIRVIQRSSGLNRVLDWIRSRPLGQELRRRLQETAVQSLIGQGLLPSREAIVERLNRVGLTLPTQPPTRLIFE